MLLLSDKQQSRTEEAKRKTSTKGKNLYMRNEFPAQYLHAHRNLIWKKEKNGGKNGKDLKYSYGFYYSFSLFFFFFAIFIIIKWLLLLCGLCFCFSLLVSLLWRKLWKMRHILKHTRYDQKNNHYFQIS